MLIKKEHSRKNKYQSSIKFRKDQVILRKGELTKQFLILEQGNAYIEQQGSLGNIVHMYNPGEILNRTEIKFGCETLKNIKCFIKCKILRTSICPQNSNQQMEKSSYSPQLEDYLAQFTKNYMNIKQIIHCSSFGQYNRSNKIQLETQFVYFCKGAFDLYNQNLHFKRIQTSTIYLILCKQGSKIHLEVLNSILFFKVKFQILKYYLNPLQLEKIIKLLNTFNHKKEVAANTRENKIYSDLFSDQYIKKTHTAEKYKFLKPFKKLDRSKILSEVCKANKNFRFSVKSKIYEKKKQKNRSLHYQSNTKITDVTKIYKQINLEFCSYHNKECPIIPIEKDFILHLMANKISPTSL